MDCKDGIRGDGGPGLRDRDLDIEAGGGEIGLARSAVALCGFSDSDRGLQSHEWLGSSNELEMLTHSSPRSRGPLVVRLDAVAGSAVSALFLASTN